MKYSILASWLFILTFSATLPVHQYDSGLDNQLPRKLHVRSFFDGDYPTQLDSSWTQSTYVQSVPPLLIMLLSLFL
ncbi:hypothetical protein BC833DRAFT_608464 [Globomyces pollinis-pini]|nr:hypothetical protein BC833DRAFT_608464 [Globomyces pollinis-pini]